MVALGYHTGHWEVGSSTKPTHCEVRVSRSTTCRLAGSGLAKGNSPDNRDGRTQRRTQTPDGIERVRQAKRLAFVTHGRSRMRNVAKSIMWPRPAKRQYSDQLIHELTT